MTAHHRREPETPLPFLATLPAEARAWTWHLETHLMLTLPDCEGQYRAFETYIAPVQRYRAHNVAWYCVPS